MNEYKAGITVRGANDGKRLASAGNIYRILASDAETNGRYALLETLVEPGQGAPLHLHEREEEAFFILEGDMVFLTAPSIRCAVFVMKHKKQHVC
ncbi:hypothetical protein KQ944_14165 [Bacillus subtilis]|uniref:hypothetical protein n=1 Tax=Pseudochrobactrum asaccharolyticum TaxID=354351 RepID=UPI001F37DDF4|nr:hypothetical protein [Pseudochrobactrum asaccharolyticum]MCF7646640.1 hypothetical protein [Pseudochrobactrum asaccharolyticum]MCF7672779.1 hypothetical protein [Bacillus subtilis]